MQKHFHTAEVCINMLSEFTTLECIDRYLPTLKRDYYNYEREMQYQYFFSIGQIQRSNSDRDFNALKLSTLVIIIIYNLPETNFLHH